MQGTRTEEVSVASSNLRASRPRARIFRRTLLAAVVAGAIGAAPASAIGFTIKPTLSSTPTGGQSTTCLPNVVGLLPLGAVIHYSWGLWGNTAYSTISNSITLSDTAGGQYLFCEVKVTNALNVILTQLTGKPADLAIISRIKGIAPSNLSLPSVSGKKRRAEGAVQSRQLERPAELLLVHLAAQRLAREQ